MSTKPTTVARQMPKLNKTQLIELLAARLLKKKQEEFEALKPLIQELEAEVDKLHKKILREFLRKPKAELVKAIHCRSYRSKGEMKFSGEIRKSNYTEALQRASRNLYEAQRKQYTSPELKDCKREIREKMAGYGELLKDEAICAKLDETLKALEDNPEAALNI